MLKLPKLKIDKIDKIATSVQRFKKEQGARIYWFGPLFFGHSVIKFKKPTNLIEIPRGGIIVEILRSLYLFIEFSVVVPPRLFLHEFFDKDKLFANTNLFSNIFDFIFDFFTI